MTRNIFTTNQSQITKQYLLLLKMIQRTDQSYEITRKKVHSNTIETKEAKGKNPKLKTNEIKILVFS